MSNDTERPVVSAGSRSVAWAVLRIDGSIYDVYANEEEAKAIDEAVTGNHGVVPLCRSPTLTDAEREAIACAAESYADNDDDEDCARVATTLRGVIERLG
jgi:hypothetical protein